MLSAAKDFRVGVAEDMNRRCRRTMEDSHSFVYDFGGVEGDGYFAIFDGHAGAAAAEWCGNNLHDHLKGNLDVLQDAPVQEVLFRTFVSTDDHFRGESRQGSLDSGCTAVVSYLRTEKNVVGSEKRVLYVANVGDARCVLGRNGKALRLTYDHKGSDPQEMKRIIDVGGFIMNNRVNGCLAVTRALGDASMKDLVTSAPYTAQVALSSTDVFMVLACDGLWDVMTDQEVVEFVQKFFADYKTSVESAEDQRQDVQLCAEALMKHALANDCTDNISCMVVKFCDDRTQ
ncbi:hypothetical protein MP228_008373 [Amoeboaphelidium protococcarum]|nr:hypothetical protein MP228_008373 [Amoeboaphelidium protococcarum]